MQKSFLFRKKICCIRIKCVDIQHLFQLFSTYTICMLMWCWCLNCFTNWFPISERFNFFQKYAVHYFFDPLLMETICCIFFFAEHACISNWPPVSKKFHKCLNFNKQQMGGSSNRCDFINCPIRASIMVLHRSFTFSWSTRDLSSLTTTRFDCFELLRSFLLVDNKCLRPSAGNNFLLNWSSLIYIFLPHWWGDKTELWPP